MLTNRLNSRLLASLTMVFLVVMTLDLLGVVRALRDQPAFLHFKLASQARLAPVQIPLRLVDDWFKQPRQLDQLEKAYLNSQAQLAKLRQLQAENQTLRQLLKVQDTLDQDLVITAPVYSQTQALVAAGKNQGLKPGSLVFAQQVFIGIVTQVTSQTASVKLLQEDPDLNLLAKTESGVTGLVKLVDGRLKLTEIPANLVVKPQEAVYTVGQPGIPSQLLIGTVKDDQPKEPSATYALELDQGVSFYEEPVVIVKP